MSCKIIDLDEYDKTLFFHPLNREVQKINIYKTISYRILKTLCHHYKNQPTDVV
jgi:hypothetical protein